MYNWFFEDPERAAAIIIELDEWEGTPFRAHSKAKGKCGGADCVGLCEGVMTSPRVGLTESFVFPRLPMDYSLHCDNSILLEYLRGAGRSEPEGPIDPQSTRLASIFQEIDDVGDPPRFIVGDLVAFKIGKCAHHLAIAHDHRRVTQVFTSGFVHTVNIDDSTLLTRFETVFRARSTPQPFSA